MNLEENIIRIPKACQKVQKLLRKCIKTDLNLKEKKILKRHFNTCKYCINVQRDIDNLIAMEKARVTRKYKYSG